MTATETKLGRDAYGILRMIDDEPGMTAAQIRVEIPLELRANVKGHLISLAEERMIAAAHFHGEPGQPLRYYSTPKGTMLLRQLEREALPKPERRSTKQVLAGFGLVILAASVLLYFSSYMR